MEMSISSIFVGLTLVSSFAIGGCLLFSGVLDDLLGTTEKTESVKKPFIEKTYELLENSPPDAPFFESLSEFESLPESYVPCYILASLLKMDGFFWAMSYETLLECQPDSIATLETQYNMIRSMQMAVKMAGLPASMITYEDQALEMALSPWIWSYTYG